MQCHTEVFAINEKSLVPRPQPENEGFESHFVSACVYSAAFFSSPFEPSTSAEIANKWLLSAMKSMLLLTTGVLRTWVGMLISPNRSFSFERRKIQILPSPSPI